MLRCRKGRNSTAGRRGRTSSSMDIYKVIWMLWNKIIVPSVAWKLWRLTVSIYAYSKVWKRFIWREWALMSRSFLYSSWWEYDSAGAWLHCWRIHQPLSSSLRPVASCSGTIHQPQIPGLPRISFSQNAHTDYLFSSKPHWSSPWRETHTRLLRTSFDMLSLP